MPKISDVLLIGVLLVAAIMDIKHRKIYNRLTIPAIAAGPFLLLFQSGLHGLTASLAGAGIMFLLGTLILFFRLAGGGDAKLLITVGALGGINSVLPSLYYTALAGGVLAALAILKRRFLLMESNYIPYGVAIAAGTTTALVMSWIQHAV